MRVGLLVYALDRPLSGISRYTLELVRALASLNAPVEIVLITAGSAHALADTGLRRIALPGCERLPALLTLGSAMLPILARRLHLDIIHDTTGVTPFVFGTGRAKKVVTLYDVIPWSLPGFSTRLDTLIYRHWLPRLLPHTDAILTISDASKSEIIRYLPVPLERVHTVYAGVSATYRPAGDADIQQVRERYSLPEKYILFLGSVEERKNLWRVIEAYVWLRDQGVTHRLVIGGPHKWKYQEILDRVTHQNLQEDILFTGYVQDDDLPALYTAADVFVFPSLFEGFGLPVLEAMACGVPVVTSNISSLPEAGGDAAILVDPYDVYAIGTAIQSILEDVNLQQQLRQKGLAHIQHFSWQVIARKTLDVYQQIIVEGSPAFP